MPDPVVILVASAIAAALAGIGWLVIGRTRRRPGSAWAAMGAAGVAAGIVAGALFLGLAPRFPPGEDNDRFLLILLPVAVLAEVVAATLGRWGTWPGWLARGVVALGAARILLHGSTYLDSAAAVWTVGQAWAVLGGLAAGLTAAWVLLGREATGPTAWLNLLSLALASAAAGAVVMLSGYASGGQIGFPLAAALGAVAVVSAVAREPADLRGPTGVGLVALFALLVAGRYFGSLTTLNALLLFSVPLMPVLAGEALGAGKFAWLSLAGRRGLLTLAPMAVVLTLTLDRFLQDARPQTQPTRSEPDSFPVDDYLNFKP